MGVAWITGAGKGIGRSVALELARRGWTVAASARTEADLDSLAQQAGSGAIIPFPLDVTDRQSVDDTVAPEDLEPGAPDPCRRFGSDNIQRALSL